MIGLPNQPQSFGGSSRPAAAVADTVEPPALPNGARISIEGLHSEVGGKLWPCAGVLTRYLNEHRELVTADASVIELGAGTGLCGLFAAGLGARRVVLLSLIHI